MASASKKEKKVLSWLAPALGFAIPAVILWLLLTFTQSELLYRIESRSLFLYTQQFFTETMAVPGGLLSYIGAFLTQFLYIPWLGALIKVLVWALASWIFIKAFGIPRHRMEVALIIAAVLVATDMQWGYQIFQMKVPGYFFSFSLGSIMAMLICLAYGKTDKQWIKILTALNWAGWGYPLFGAYAMLGAAAMAVMSLKKKEWAAASVSLIAGAIAPAVWNAHYLTATLSGAYMAALPILRGIPELKLYWLPFILFAICLLAAAATDWQKSSRINSTINLAVSALIAIVLAGAFWFRDANFKAENGMTRAIDRSNWKEAVKIFSATTDRFEKSNDKIQAAGGATAEDYYAPTRIMVMYRNLALFKLGTAGSRAFTFKDGSSRQKHKAPLSMINQAGKQLFYNYGILNFCYRWCTEDYVEFGWSYENLEYMTRTSIVQGNKDVALRYLGALDHSLFHRKWADKERQYIDNPELVANSQEYSDVVQMQCTDDYLDSDKGELETYLMKYFTRRHTTQSPRFQEAAMTFAMQSQDIQTFWQILALWITTHPDTDMPRHYQEAAYLYCQLEKTFDISQLPFDKDIPASYQAFMQYNYKHPFKDPAEQLQNSWRKCGKNFYYFYYFYYFIRNLKSY